MRRVQLVRGGEGGGGDLQAGKPGLVRARGGGNELDDVLPAVLPALLLEKVLPAKGRVQLVRRDGRDVSTLYGREGPRDSCFTNAVE
jgi:hypothetical protein